MIAPPSLADGLAEVASDRAWTVLNARVGFQTRTTYMALGRALDTTRGRAWQIYTAVATRLADPTRLTVIEHALDALDAAWPPRWTSIREGLVPDVLRAGQEFVVTAGYGVTSEGDVRRLLLIPRALADSGHDEIQTRYPYLAHAACALPPAIMSHPEVAAEVARARRDDNERQRGLTYTALAVAVLQDARGPLHWREIVDRVDALGRRARVNSGALFNALTAHADLFAHVGPGIYGLTAWDVASVAPYPDLIAQALHDAGRPLTSDEIRRSVVRVRPITSGSLQLCLATHARFYRSLDGTYGLRVWLPLTSGQRLPRWRVEDETSALRVGRAEARGIDVRRMMARDAHDA